MYHYPNNAIAFEETLQFSIIRLNKGRGKMLALISTNEIVIQSSDALRVLGETVSFDIWGFISTTLATGIGAFIGVILTLKLNYRFEQKKIQLTMVKEMYYEVRKHMQICTKEIQATRRLIESNKKSGLTYPNVITQLIKTIECIETLTDKLTYYKFETLLYFKIIGTLKIRHKNLEELQKSIPQRPTKDGIEILEDVYKRLGEINMVISRLEGKMFNDYIKMMGLNKSDEYKEYNKLVEQDIEENIEDIRNSDIPFGVRILNMEENQEL